MGINISIVGAGAYGSRIAEKYKKFPDVRLKAVVSRKKPAVLSFMGISFVASAAGWKKKFGSPRKDDVFDLCIHQNILIKILEDFIKIGAKNFILPKPIALTLGELERIRMLAHRHKLKIAVASQWHYSGLLTEIKKFLNKNGKNILKIEITFSRLFDEKRRSIYTPHTAFVPHIVQILHSLGLISSKTGAIVESTSDTKIRIKYVGRYNIHAESSINVQKKNETLKIYLKGKSKPALVTDFSGILGQNGFTEYPSVTRDGKRLEVKEDLLEKMIGKKLSYFSGIASKSDASGNTMTLENYIPVALAVINVVDRASRLVAVIGGGIFGILSALEIARRGYSVVVFEKEPEILTGASLVNHCRVHMGYHYPRDERTARESNEARRSFEKVFGKDVVLRPDNYYMVAKEGSYTTAEDFLAFCKKMGLPYKKEWPKELNVSKDKIALSVKVPEPIFDVNRKRAFLYKKLAELPNVTLLKVTDVTGLRQIGDGFEISYKSAGVKGLTYSAAVVNATYGGMNYINQHLGLPLKDFQYELCEIPVVSAPWNGSAWMIIDGPFFSVMPFGFSKKYLFYDVELSVLERVIGKFPEFKKKIAYYDAPKRRAARFKRYHAKWKSWVSGINDSKQLYSMYVTRAVLPRREKTDERPTIVNRLFPGFWQIFSGKIVTSVSSTIELAVQIDNFLKDKNKKKM